MTEMTTTEQNGNSTKDETGLYPEVSNDSLPTKSTEKEVDKNGANGVDLKEVITEIPKDDNVKPSGRKTSPLPYVIIGLLLTALLVGTVLTLYFFVLDEQFFKKSSSTETTTEAGMMGQNGSTGGVPQNVQSTTSTENWLNSDIPPLPGFEGGFGPLVNEPMYEFDRRGPSEFPVFK